MNIAEGAKRSSCKSGMQALHVAFDIMRETAVSFVCSSYDPCHQLFFRFHPAETGSIQSRDGSDVAQGLGVNAHPPRKP